MKDRKDNWTVLLPRVVFVLLVLVMASAWMMVGLYARYTVSDSASDSSRVARFQITETGISTQTIQLTLYPGEDPKYMYTIQLENLSEVAVAYTVSVENETENLPLTFTVGGQSGSATGALSTQGTGASVSLPLNVAWDNSNSSDIYHREIDQITVTVVCTQID